MLPEDETKRRKVAPPSKRDTYDLSEPVAPVKRAPPTVAPSILERTRPLEEAEVSRPTPTRLPFLIGVFNFPFYLRTLAAWGMISIGMTLALLGGVVCLYLYEQVGAMAVRFFALPPLAIAGLTLSYASACSMTVIETTAEGYDEVIDWPAGFWRDWFFTFMGASAILALSGAIGGVIGKWLGIGVWLPAAWTAYLLFPIFALSILEAGSPTALISWPVLRSFLWVWWGWLLFYAETGALIAVSAVVTVAAFRLNIWVGPLVAGPLLAAVMLVFARLIGRLVWCIGEYGDEASDD